jgi:rare lipoprotein A
MPLFGLVWVTSWVSYFLASTQSLLKVPDYLTNDFPAKVFSIVSSPPEIPTPWGFPMPLNSGIWSSNSSITTVPNLVLQTSAAPFQFRSQPAQQAAVRPLFQQDLVKNTFCNPESELKKDPIRVASVSQSQSALSEEISSSNVSKATLPQQILQVMQNLLPWRQRVEPNKTLASSVEVRSTHSGDRVGDKHNTDKSDKKLVKRGLWRYSQMLASRVTAATPPKNQEQFQVWVKGRLIAQLPNQQQAELMAQRLKQFLSNSSDPYLNASPVEPALVEGVPAVRIGARLLFKVDDALAKKLDRNPELLVIEWTNNLRIALRKAPLKLADAQKRLYKLVETPKTFTGQASWYGPNFHGRITATGETYNQHELTAAHPSLPFDTYLKVRNLKNNESVIVRINDRGPYIPNRTLDLSRQAARCIRGEKAGIMRFEAVVMQQPSAQSGKYLVRN